MEQSDIASGHIKPISITVDLDGALYYERIHGVDRADQADVKGVRPDALYDGPAMERMLQLFNAYHIKATLFVIASDVERYPRLKSNLQRAVEAGHEIASHSLTHDYGMIERSIEAIQSEVMVSKSVLERALDCDIMGFRAPGYNTSQDVFEALNQAGYGYDSSIFGSPVYYLARRAILSLYRWIGRQSHSLIGDWRAFVGVPVEPYTVLPGAPYHKKSPKDHIEPTGTVQVGIREFPIRSDMGLMGIPLIGTNIVAWPGWLVRWMTRRQMRRSGHWVVEFHLIDFADASDGFPAEVLVSQRDTRLSYALKHQRLSAFFDMIRSGRIARLKDWL